MNLAALLFLSKNCPECAIVRAALKPEKVESDSFLGKNGQKLYVFSSMTDSATIHMMTTFGHAGKHTPLLVSHDGSIIATPNGIVSYLKREGFC